MKENANKANRKEMWFDFRIRYTGENIGKGSPLFSKNLRSMQNLKHICYEIPNFTYAKHNRTNEIS